MLLENGRTGKKQKVTPLAVLSFPRGYAPQECKSAGNRVVITGSIGKQRSITVCGVVEADSVSHVAPEAPVAVLLLPVVELERASAPIAVFSPAVVLFVSAPMPMAVLLLAVLLSPGASTPMAVLLLPVVFELSAPPPMAVLPKPLVLLKRANPPLAVLREPRVVVKKRSLANGGVFKTFGVAEKSQYSISRVAAAGRVAV